MGFVFPGVMIDYRSHLEPFHWVYENSTTQIQERFDQGRLIDGYSAKTFNSNYTRKRFSNCKGRKILTKKRLHQILEGHEIINEDNTTDTTHNNNNNITDSPKVIPTQSTLTLTDLPSEIISRILVESQNINSIQLTCQFFRNFIVHHKIDLQYAIIRYHYVTNISLELTNPVVLSSTHLAQISDSEHMDNALHTHLDQTVRLNNLSRRSRDDEYSGTNDKIVVLRSGALTSQYFRIGMLRKFEIDMVLNDQDLENLKLEVRKGMNKLEDSIMNGREISSKLIKRDYLENYPGSAIDLPFMNTNRAKDTDYIIRKNYRNKLEIIKKLIDLRCTFTQDLEEIVIFLIYLNRAANKSKEVPATMDKHDFFLDLKNMKTLINLKMEKIDAAEDDAENPEMVVKNPHLIMALLNHAPRKWIRYFFHRLDRDEFENNVEFWAHIIKIRNWKHVELLKKYADLEPSPAVLSKVANL